MALSPFDSNGSVDRSLVGGSAANNAMGQPGLTMPNNFGSPKAMGSPAPSIPNTAPSIPNMAIPSPLPIQQPVNRAPVQQPAGVVGYNAATDEVFSAGHIIPMANKSVAFDYMKAGAFNYPNDPHKMPEGFTAVEAKPFEDHLNDINTNGRSTWDAIKEGGNQFVQGITHDVPSMVNKLAAATSSGLGATDSKKFFDSNASYWDNSAKPADLLGRGGLAKTGIGAARNLGPQALAIGASLLSEGSLSVPAMAATSALFGGGQAEDTINKGLAAGASSHEANVTGLETGLIEGLGDYAFTVIGGRFVKGGASLLAGAIKDGKITAEAAVKAATNPEWAKGFAKSYAESIGLEASTEFAQDYAEGAIEKNKGYSKDDPMAAGVEGASQAAFMTGLLGPFGALSHHSAAANRSQLGTALADFNQPINALNAAEALKTKIAPQVGEAEANAWGKQQAQAGAEFQHDKATPGSTKDMFSQEYTPVTDSTVPSTDSTQVADTISGNLFPEAPKKAVKLPKEVVPKVQAVSVPVELSPEQTLLSEVGYEKPGKRKLEITAKYLDLVNKGAITRESGDDMFFGLMAVSKFAKMDAMLDAVAKSASSDLTEEQKSKDGWIKHISTTDGSTFWTAPKEARHLPSEDDEVPVIHAAPPDIPKDVHSQEFVAHLKDTTTKLLVGVTKIGADSLKAIHGVRKSDDRGWKMDKDGLEMQPSSLRALASGKEYSHEFIRKQVLKATGLINKNAAALGITPEAAMRILGLQGEPSMDVGPAAKSIYVAQASTKEEDEGYSNEGEAITALRDDATVPKALDSLASEEGKANEGVANEAAASDEVHYDEQVDHSLNAKNYDDAQDVYDLLSENQAREGQEVLTWDNISNLDRQLFATAVRAELAQPKGEASMLRLQNIYGDIYDSLDTKDPGTETANSGQVEPGGTSQTGSPSETTIPEVPKQTNTAVTTKKPRKFSKESTGNNFPDYGKMTPLQQEFSSAKAAAEWLSTNAGTPALRLIAGKLKSLVSDVSLVYLKPGDLMPPDIARKFNGGTLGLAVLSKGETTVYIMPSKEGSNTHETMLHELVHAATMEKLLDPTNRSKFSELARQVRYALSDLMVFTKFSAEKSKGIKDFFSKQFMDEDEFLAYTLTSPTMQELMLHLASDGRHFGMFRTRSEAAEITKPNTAREQDYIPEPSYSMFHKLVDFIRGLIGLPRVYANALRDILSVNEAVRKNNELAQKVTYLSLSERVHSLFDDLLASDATQAKNLGEDVSKYAGESDRSTENAGWLPNDRRLTDTIKRATDETSVIKELITRKTTSAVMGGMFGHDFAKYASNELSGVADYFKAVSDKMVERATQEEIIDKILRHIDDTFTQPEKDKINKFLLTSQYEHAKKYFEQPSWISEAVEVDPAFKKDFDTLSDKQKDAARSIFKEGDRQWTDVQNAIQLALPEGEKLAKAKLEGLYISLKRVGDYTVVAKSKEYVHNEDLAGQGDVDARKWIEDNKDNEDHHYVSFTDSEYAALKEKAALLDANPSMEVRAAQAEFHASGLGEMQFQTYKRIEEMVSNSTMDNPAKKEALKKVVQQLYIQSLNQQHALKSRMQRKRVKGANPDALRVFALQGRANAALVASLKTSGPLQEALQRTRGQANTASQKAIINELLKRHAAMTQYRATPLQDKFTAYASVHLLLISPAYYLQNMTQPFMYSMPVVAGKHGYSKTMSSFISAWGSTFSMVKFLNKDALDIKLVGKLSGNVGQEQKAMQNLMDRNLLDVGISADLSDFADKSILPRPVRKMIRVLRGIATNVETLNRLSTALAAYRLEYEAQIGKGKSAEEAHNIATEYAGGVIIDTHGDYSGYNAPRYLMQGNSSMPIKVMAQFRKFQFIQIALLTKLTKQAFYGATAEERTIGRLGMTFLLGQLAVVTGGLGLPLVSLLSGMGLSGDDDKEARLRRLIGNKDVANILLHGVPAGLGLDVGNKLGMTNTFDPAAFVNAGKSPQDTLKNYAAAFVGGPSLSIAMQMMAGYGDMTDKGQYQKGLEKMLPLGMANISKAIRFQDEGVTGSNGDVLLKPEDISVISSIMQAVGLPTTEISDRAWRGEALFKANEYYAKQSTELITKYAAAARDNNSEAKTELRNDWTELQTQRKERGFNMQPLSTLLKAPMQQAKRERSVSDGVEFTKQNANFVKDLSTI